MSYRLTPNRGPSIINDRYTMDYNLDIDANNGHVRKIEQLHSEGVNFGIDFDVNINGQTYSANLSTKSTGVKISLIDARSVLDYESQSGQTLDGNRIDNSVLRDRVIDSLARAGEKELKSLEKKLFGIQKRL